MSSSDSLTPAAEQKRRTGLNRILHATVFSIAGLRAAWGETAFRQEACAAFLLVPVSFWLGHHWIETALLAGSVMLVLIAELLNSAVEAAVDRVGSEWHAMAKRAKDMGSAAVLLSLLLAGGIWTAALWQRFMVA